MNNLKNNVRLIGHVGAAPEVKSFEKGDNGQGKLARFSLATNEYYLNKSGEKVETTEWHNLVAWGKTADLAERLLTKGAEVAVEGKLTSRSYEKDGEKRYVTEVVVGEMLMLGRKTA